MLVRSLILLLFGHCLAAGAQTVPEEALEAFRSGLYERALAQTGEGQPADLSAFRARVLLAQAVTVTSEPPEPFIREALAEAEEALSFDPGHVEGRLQKAIALSLLLRPMSPVQAARTGLGQKSRSLAEDVLEDDPDNFYAHGFLAVWHLEVVHRGGMIGSAVMGASLGSARMHHAAALRQRPDDIGLHWQWARSLAALDAGRHRAEITGALRQAGAVPPENMLESVMQARARELLAACDRLKPGELSRLAETML